ncbi:M50 family metallopeptidase [Pseudonocardia spinosispora]|uniref:M50 family metallopeptidase n=1 Tax=Pseudonocardia spinosispora TaxID=103441 RepID=UPI0004236810|nr:site-2 protease family protein [Pseudonocardia spinosispora]
MSFALGVVLFAVGIGLSIALHEAGHMWTAKAFGMKVRRYFIGFGPKVFSFRRGETEYGLKWIPAGGFCDIAGMTALDPVTPEEEPRAFYRRKTWKRVVVLSAGSVMHFIIGIILLYVMAVSGLLPPIGGAYAGQVSCVPASQDPTTLAPTPCDPAQPPPAQKAGIRSGDHIVSVGGTPTPDWDAAVTVIRTHFGPTPFVIERDGKQLTLTVDVASVQRAALDAKPGEHNALAPAGAIGLAPLSTLQYGPVDAVPATFVFTGKMFEATWQGLKMFPEKVPAVWAAIGGAQDIDRPISMVGASVIGGDAAEKGQWATFLLLLAALNFFVGVFNLMPLLPLDGGHIAVNLYERVRDAVRRRLGKVAMPPVDYTRLLPLTYVVILIFGAISLLTITADIVNPIRLPQ